jgi:hypothetical protein
MDKLNPIPFWTLLLNLDDNGIQKHLRDLLCAEEIHIDHFSADLPVCANGLHPSSRPELFLFPLQRQDTLSL